MQNSLVAIGIPEEYLIEIGAETDGHGRVSAKNVYEAYVEDGRIILGIADDLENLTCDRNCQTCPCRNKCSESEENNESDF